MLSSFQDGGSIARLRTAIEKRLAGTEIPQTTAAKVDSLLDAIRHSPIEAPEVLYRGMTVKGKLETVLAKYEPGQALDLSLTSFSGDRSIATKFQGMTAKGGNETKVMVRWVGSDKRAVPIQNLPKDRRLFKEKEWVTTGRYRIVNVRKQAGQVILDIEQVGTL